MSTNNAPPTKTEDKQAHITDYLQAPRKKRKNFVILAIPKGFESELVTTIVGFIRQHFPQLAISHPESKKELTRQFGRNISLLIIDHEFATGEHAVLKLIRSLKVKRKEEVIPVLFLTKNPAKLIAGYHKILLPYQEADDYIVYKKDSKQKLLSRIRSGIDATDARKSRRFKIDHEIMFFHLDQTGSIRGKLVDISVHGAQIIANNSILFKEGDQIKISIPIGNKVHSEFGDFLKISARVRRVFIGGNHAGISFEYVSENQNIRLTKFVVACATSQMSATIQNLKNQAAVDAKNRT